MTFASLLRSLPCLFLCATASLQAALPPGWFSTDIGSVSTPGTASETGGVFTITSAGLNMTNGNTNQHHYLYRLTSGDCSIVARVASMGNTSVNAKVGVMIRETTIENAAFASMSVSPSWGTVTLAHPNNQAWYEGVGNSTGSAPYWVRLIRTNNAIAYAISPNGTTWTTLGTYNLTMGTTATIGLFVYSNSATVNTATFDNVTATGTTLPPIPAFTGTDIGTTGATGSFSEAGGVYTVNGAGATVWGTTEQSRFVWVPLSGNGTGNGSIIARLTSQQNTNANALAGVAIRNNLNQDSTTVYLARKNSNEVRFQYHRPTESWSSQWSTTSPALPCWLKLERTGNTFTGSSSTNGTTWTVLQTVTNLVMGQEVYVGLMVNSGVNGTLNTSVFDNLVTTGTNPLTPGWVSVDLGTPGLAGSGKEVTNFTVKGAGTGFAGNVDSGQFVYKQITGETQIVARVASQTGATSTSAPAALMVRDSLTTDSKNVVLALSTDKTLRFQSHLNAGDVSSTIATTAGLGAPYWLKLTRVGNVITGYYSSDGWNWLSAGSATVTFNATAYYGLAVSSKSTSQLQTVTYDQVSLGPLTNIPAATTPIMTDILSGLTLIDTIDTATVAPVYQSATSVSTVATILGQPARLMTTTGTPGDTAGTFAYVIGQNKGLVAGRAYVLTVDYPEDVSRAFYITNRGADYIRGLATGQAVGDARDQFAEPSVESLNYPLSGTWQTYKEFFYLLDRFQGVVGVKETVANGRPYLPVNGFHVAITRLKRDNDPRSAGAAVGVIRLYEVTNPSALYAPINYPPPNLPRRSIFWREEMADGLLVSTGNANDNAISDPVIWYQQKMRMAKILGINTFAKDLLEFGFNQGWQTGDVLWTLEAQPPCKDLWTRLVPKVTAEGFDLMPYFEYKGGIGATGQGLADQRRAHKLYDGIKTVCGTSTWYDCIWWTANTNADLTDPDTLIDAKRMLDRTVGDFQTQGKFAGVWFRMRGNSLPMSFAPNTIARFKAAFPGDPEAQTATQATLITSYEGTKTLYNKYVNWWFDQRVAFLTSLRDYLRVTLNQPDGQILFTPWGGEAVPTLHALNQPYGQPGVVTDDPTWWNAYSNSFPPGWMMYHWFATSYNQAITDDLYQMVLEERLPINHGSSGNMEFFHNTPSADPLRYKLLDGVSMTYPTGRLFTLEDSALLDDYRCASGLTTVRHYALNEDNATGTPSPFNGQLGYLSVDCDRASHHLMLQNARAVAKGDPRNIGYLSASSFSTGFPEIMRRWNQAFLAVPALPSTVVSGAASNPAVVVRRITTTGQGTYFYVVNTSMSAVSGVTVTLTGSGTVKNLVTKVNEAGLNLTLNLDSAELRAYRVGP
jgi:regulation of enolase protein 1 (concanavalin A-like superfamily)